MSVKSITHCPGEREFWRVPAWRNPTRLFTATHLAKESGLEEWTCLPGVRASPGRAPTARGAHLHDAVPVVPCRDSEEGQEGHAKVPEGGMPAQALAGVRLVTL